MQQSHHFIFDGVSSKDMGVAIGSTNTGLFEEAFLPSRTIIEKKVAHREKPYLQRVEHEPLSFSLSFFIEEWDNHDSLRRIARWLFQPYYKPLILDSNPNRIFYVIIEGDSKLLHNGAKDGYVELTLRGDSPYSYTAETTTENIEFRNTDSDTVVENDSTNFNGTMNNTIVESNGLTIDKVTDTWGDVLLSNTHWGDIL